MYKRQAALGAAGVEELAGHLGAFRDPPVALRELIYDPRFEQDPTGARALIEAGRRLGFDPAYLGALEAQVDRE